MEILNHKARPDGIAAAIQDPTFTRGGDAQFRIDEIERHKMNVVLQQIEHSRFERAQLARGWHAARREQHAHVKVASGTRVATRARRRG